MAWNVPATATRQHDESEGRSDSGDKTHSVSYKGPYLDLQTAADALETSDQIDTGWYYASHELRRVPGSLGILTITCLPHPASGEGTSQNPRVAEPLKDIWSIQSVRNDVSVMAYCGDSPGRNPQRALIEAWMKEPDGTLAKDYKFRKPDGSIFEITEDATLVLIAKIEKGVEAVIRFYPVVTRTRTYAEVPPACLENLGFINTPPVPVDSSTEGKKPNGLKTAVSAHQWLKCKDDAQEQSDGKWTRTEAWMGIAKSDENAGSPWDKDLYGVRDGATNFDRWTMPYDHNAGGNN